MQKGSSSRVKEDYFSGSSDNPEREPEPVKPVNKNYGTETKSQGHWEGVKVRYEISIKPDENGRMKF